MDGKLLIMGLILLAPTCLAADNFKGLAASCRAKNGMQLAMVGPRLLHRAFREAVLHDAVTSKISERGPQ